MRRSLMAVALSAGVFAGGASAQQCETGKVDVAAISQAEYEQLASQAGADACITPRSSGLTLCQILPPILGIEEWVVVGQAPVGGHAAVELSIYVGRKCLFNAVTPFEQTDSRWVVVSTAADDLESVDEAQPRDFIAVLQIGPGSQTTSSVCPKGDGHDGKSCQEWNGWQ